MSFQSTSSRLTIRDLQKSKLRGDSLSMLTAYDFTMASLLDRAGVDVLLVGDSLANVVLGHSTTLPVSLDEMIHHTKAVVRGTKRSLVVCDLPFGSTTDPETTLQSAIRALKETGCEAVKLEGGLPAVSSVQRLVEQGIPVMGHLGLTPQSIHQLGGYFRHGKTEGSRLALLNAALALEAAGAFSVVLECVMPEVAEEITKALRIPTFGIGSGTKCDGQVLVTHDLLGYYADGAPKLADPYRRPQQPEFRIGELVQSAARQFIDQIKEEYSKNSGLLDKSPNKSKDNSKDKSDPFAKPEPLGEGVTDASTSS